MRKALIFTVYNRLHYLNDTLKSWHNVRGLGDWDIFVSIEPSPVQNVVVDLFRSYLPVKHFAVNPVVYGVLHHPWLAIDSAFMDDYEFVVRAEDDLTVSTDILEYFAWAAEELELDKDVAIVNGFSTDPREAPDEVVLTPNFSPWLWGTWAWAWEDFIRRTWDHDYSTFNGTPGNQSGWDWNLNTRVLPRLGKVVVAPVSSRVHNIGVNGTHGDEGNYFTTPNFVADREAVQYRLVR